MPKLQIIFKQIDPEAKADIATVTLVASQPFSAHDDFLLDNIRLPGNYATLEPNYTVLDGSMTEFPDDTTGKTWGLWSSDISDATGVFAVPPSIDITFGALHKSSGLTLHFYPHTGDYASSARVTWYSGDDVIASGVYTLVSTTGVVREAVEGFTRVSIEFLTTSIPHRYVRLYALDYGVMRVIEDDEINACRVVEEIDPTVETLSINGFDANIRTRDSIFSPITSRDADSMMMRRQMMSVVRDGEPFGTFFLEEWEDIYQSGIVFDITGEDAIGVLDRYSFMGDIYAGKPVIELLDEIFAVAFPTGAIKYVIDPAFAEARVSGWVPSGSCREALQHVCFALNAVADTARIGDVLIYPRETDINEDATASSDDVQPFVDLPMMATSEPPVYIASLEPNYTVLDGALRELPDDTAGVNVGWVSQSMTDQVTVTGDRLHTVNGDALFTVNGDAIYVSKREAGVFSTPPVLEITFASSHNSDATTIYFGAYAGEYNSRMRVTWYDEYDEIIKSGEYTFTGNPGVISDAVKGYRRIRFEALEMNAANRYARISAIDYGASFRIPLAKQYRRGHDRPTPYYSGVEVVSHSYTPGDEVMEAQKGELPAGRHTITFNEPLHTLAITGGSIVSSNANHAVVDVQAAGEVVLTGRRYIDNRRSHIAHSGFVAAGEVESVKRYDGFTLVSPAEGDALAASLYDYLQQRVRTETDVVLDDLEVGYIARVETRGREIVGTIESLDSNLRGNKAKMVVVGAV